MLNATIIEGLALQVADVLETTDELASNVTFGEMADGSRRHYALIDTYSDDGLEQQYRIATPADDPDTPAWATAQYGVDDYTLEIRVGDGWLTLEQTC